MILSYYIVNLLINRRQLSVEEQIASDLSKKQKLKEVADKEKGWESVNIKENRWKRPDMANKNANST